MINLKCSSQHKKTTITTAKINPTFKSHWKMTTLIPKRTNKKLNLNNNNKLSSLHNKSNSSEHMNLMKYSTLLSIWTLTIISKRILYLQKRVMKDRRNNFEQVFYSKTYWKVKSSYQSMILKGSHILIFGSKIFSTFHFFALLFGCLSNFKTKIQKIKFCFKEQQLVNLSNQSLLA